MAMNEWIVVYAYNGLVILLQYKKEQIIDLCYKVGDIKNVMPCQRSQTQKTHSVYFHSFELFRIGKSIDT